MALTFASYVVPGPGWARRVVAVVAVAGLTGLNYRGVRKTATLARALLTISLIVLTTVVIGIAVGGKASAAHLTGWPGLGAGGAYGVLQAAGLLFFAFAGYARIATLGEEVREPARTIPRAILTALGLTAGLYLIVALAALSAAGPRALAGALAPLAVALHAAGAGALDPVVRIGAAAASLGALLSLLAGIGRTSLAMARYRDLPTWLGAVHPRFRVPHHAEVALGVLVSALAATLDLRAVIGFSSFGVLIYYAIANAAAYTQPATQRRWPRPLNLLGLAGCLLLVATLPWQSAAAGTAMFTIGLAGRSVALCHRGRPPYRGVVKEGVRKYTESGTNRGR